MDPAKKFFNEFGRIYATQHGGNIIAKEPAFVAGNLAKGGEMITEVWNAGGNKFQMKPQILFFVVNDKNSDTYLRIKKSCECRYGVVSQVLQAQHVFKMSPQYISNVCMKVNAKLGGYTCKAVGQVLPKIAPDHMKRPTMIIGADVSHAAPGAIDAASMAAITMTINKECTRYAAQCDTNGARVEMITTTNINNLCGRLFKMWQQMVGNGNLPERVYYIRDGVSEGQYQQVLESEVRDMKELFRTLNPKANVKFTVVIASKRHHVRFFPGPGGRDRNGNPMPGTLVETGCTHPFEFDFYLCAHSAIKGTARPIHYHVLLNETGMGAEELEQMIFEHSFQYVRSTTPVSLHPAVYYAHLASNRAKAHADKQPIPIGKKETAKKQTGTATASSDKTPIEVAPLLQMDDHLGINASMWYI